MLFIAFCSIKEKSIFKKRESSCPYSRHLVFFMKSLMVCVLHFEDLLVISNKEKVEFLMLKRSLSSKVLALLLAVILARSLLPAEAMAEGGYLV